MTAPPGDLARLRLELLAILDEIEHEIMYADVHERTYPEMRDEITERRADSDATSLNSYSHLYARSQVMMIVSTPNGSARETSRQTNRLPNFRRVCSTNWSR